MFPQICKCQTQKLDNTGCVPVMVCMRNAPPSGLLCLNTWSQLVSLFGEIMELLGGGAMLEEAYFWGGLWGTYCPTITPHPLHLLIPICSAPSVWMKQNQPASYLLLLAILDSPFGTTSQSLSQGKNR